MSLRKELEEWVKDDVYWENELDDRDVLFRINCIIEIFEKRIDKRIEELNLIKKNTEHRDLIEHTILGLEQVKDMLK